MDIDNVVRARDVAVVQLFGQVTITGGSGAIASQTSYGFTAARLGGQVHLHARPALPRVAVRHRDPAALNSHRVRRADDGARHGRW